MSYNSIMVYDIKALETLAQGWVDKASKAYDRPFHKIAVSLDLKGTCAGKAYHWENRIKLNRFLLNQNPEEMINQTLPHEIAHVIAHIQYPFCKRGHGPEWRSVMRMFGLEPDRCHEFNTSNVGTWKLKRFEWLCPCGPKTMAAIRHKRALKNIRERGNSGYTCRKCKTYLAPGSAGQAGVQRAILDSAETRARRARERVRASAKRKAHDHPWTRPPLKTRAVVQPKTWAPKAGSKGALALDIYREWQWTPDAQIVALLVQKMGIKKGNARAYLALCKKA